MRYIEIEKELLPLGFEIELGDALYRMEVYYNSEFDYFTVDLYSDENEPILLGEKLSLNEPLFEVIAYKKRQNLKLIPIDPTGLEKRITFENFNKQVFLAVVENE